VPIGLLVRGWGGSATRVLLGTDHHQENSEKQEKPALQHLCAFVVFVFVVVFFGFGFVLFLRDKMKFFFI